MIMPALRQGIIIFLVLLMQATPTSASSLKNHPSPYLELHADDPVDWKLWGTETLKQARQQNKLIFLSIGYFSCHWCHVMQRESYQNDVIAKYLNEHFISVKVDRELRPQLDRRMIAFVEAVNGQAGWPLNVFVTADGYPVTGFTYLPPVNFLSVVQQLQGEWQNRDEEISSAARSYFEQTETNELQTQAVTLDFEHYNKVVEAFISQAMALADELQGGFGDTSKFPSYPQINAMLQVVKQGLQSDKDISAFVKLTLDTMASRHLMDHVNGGFFRYTTDPDWQTPHYEKMLYDNAQLAVLYSDAETVWPGSGYRQLAQRTVDFMLDFLQNDRGSFASSLSAVDVEDREGEAYLWTTTQLKSALTDEQYRQFVEQQQWNEIISEGRLLKPLIKPVNYYSNTPETAILKTLKRSPRAIMPRDDKVLASWNALALQAILAVADGSTDAAQKQRYMTAAGRLYDELTASFVYEDDGQLLVTRFAGQADASETTLEDFALMARAFALYAQQQGSKQAASYSLRLIQTAFDEFYQQGYWLPNRDSLVPGEKGDIVMQDDVLEAPQSVLLKTLWMLDSVPADLQQRARPLMPLLTRDVLEVPYHYPTTILQAYHYTQQHPENANLNARK